MNWKEDSVIIAHRVRRQRKRTATKHHGKIVRLMRLGIVILYAIIDFVVAIYKRESSMQTNVSFVAHLGGVVAGFLVGIVILRNRKVEAWETRLKKLCFVIIRLGMIIVPPPPIKFFGQSHNNQHCKSIVYLPEKCTSKYKIKIIDLNY